MVRVPSEDVELTRVLILSIFFSIKNNYKMMIGQSVGRYHSQ